MCVQINYIYIYIYINTHTHTRTLFISKKVGKRSLLNFYIHAFSRCFYPKKLTVHSRITDSCIRFRLTVFACMLMTCYQKADDII